MTAPNPVWETPPDAGLLARGSIHIWRAGLDPPTARVAQLAQTLSMDERRRADRFYFEKDRKRFIVGRGILRAILGRYLHIEPAQVSFHYEARGKPVLGGSLGGGPLHFNLSHSGEVALYAITRDQELGIDIERIRPIPEFDVIARRFFSPQENAALCALPADDRTEAFFNAWTRKEAFIKASGNGLSQPLDQFDVSLAPGEPARLLRVAGDAQEAARWLLWDIKPAAGYAAALAVRGHGWRLACWQWPE